jgi:hypothetical protein
MVAALIVGSGAQNVNYDAARQGQLPPGWSAPASHEWEVRSDKSAPSHPNVLQASGASGQSDAPLAVFDQVVCRDGDLSVKFRIDGRQRGNAAGIVWRYLDASNYYLLSVSADDKNIVLRRIRNGVTEVISPDGGKPGAVGVAEDVKPDQWHVVKVSFRGPKVQVFFGNRSIFTAEDSGILTAGKTGLWARGANGASFDDFRIDKKS